MKAIIEASEKSGPITVTKVQYSPEEEKARKEIDQKAELIEKFEKYKRSEDLLEDCALAAAKRIIYESEFAPKSSERLKAATEVLHMAKGKPVNKTLSVTMDVSSKEENEVDSEIEKYERLLGLRGKHDTETPKLIMEDDAIDAEWTDKNN